MSNQLHIWETPGLGLVSCAFGGAGTMKYAENYAKEGLQNQAPSRKPNNLLAVVTGQSGIGQELSATVSCQP